MPRPPKYTDDDIAEAIASLIVVGMKVNPSRVKQRLGGGNIVRIKAVIDRKDLECRAVMAGIPDLPSSMSAELRLHNGQSLKRIEQLATRLWQLACDEALKARTNEDVALRSRIPDVDEKLAEANRQPEEITSTAHRESATIANENRLLKNQCEQLKEALRNAESDLRAAKKTIIILERTQRQDRAEIRSLQKRVEELAAAAKI